MQERNPCGGNCYLARDRWGGGSASRACSDLHQMGIYLGGGWVVHARTPAATSSWCSWIGVLPSRCPAPRIVRLRLGLAVYRPVSEMPTVEPGVDGVGGLADVERSGHDLLARLGGTRYRGVEGCAGSVIWKLRSWT